MRADERVEHLAGLGLRDVAFVVDEDLRAAHELVHAFAEGVLEPLEPVPAAASRVLYARGLGFYLVDGGRVVTAAERAWFTPRGQAWCWNPW